MVKCCKCGVNRQAKLFLEISKQLKTLKTCAMCRGDVIPQKQVQFNEQESDSGESESSSSHSESSDEESEDSSSSDDCDSIVCGACNKSFDDEASAIKHVNTLAHKKRWTLYKLQINRDKN
jgi:hypothetical protein